MIPWSDFSIGDHRVSCPTCGRRPNDKTMGVTIAGEDHGVAHCFRCGHVETRESHRELTPAERKAYARRMDAMRQQHEAEKRQRQAGAAAIAAVRWAGGFPVRQHPYLQAKNVRPHGLRVGTWQRWDAETRERFTIHDVLYVPMRDTAGQMHSLQGITPEGEKLFLPGGRLKGCYHAIGRPNGRLVVCEGYATGATIHEASGHAVAVAFNSGNLLPVAQALRAKFPCLTLVLAADDDHLTDGNPGVTAATAAAKAVGGLLAVPNFTGYARGPKDTDFNDLQRLAEALEVAH